VSDSAQWGFVCGVAAVLETHLLPPRSVAEIADALPGPREILARVRQNPVYAGGEAGHDDAMQLAGGLESELAGYLTHFAARCPDERIVDVFLIDYDLRDLANHLKWKYCDTPRRPVALSRLPAEKPDDVIADDDRLAELAQAVARTAAQEGSLEPLTIDLLIDGGFLAMLPGLVAPLGSPTLNEWARERQRLTAIETVVRAKFSGLGAVRIRETLLRQTTPDHHLAALVDAEVDQLDKALDAALPPEAADRINLRQGADALPALAAYVDEQLERTLEPARTVVAGPERVFRYLWLLVRENRNLRAILGGIAGRIAPGLVSQSMRGVA